MLSPTENAMVSYAILEQVDADREGGVDPTYLAIDVARAQVYATLAAVPQPPTQDALTAVIRDALDERGLPVFTEDAQVAAAAVEAIL